MAAALPVLAGLYLLQALTPMRLDNDSVVYLRIATELTDRVQVHSTGLPIGYSVMIALLEKLGLGYSFVFVLANCAFIALGLVSTSYVFGHRGVARSLSASLALLSFVLVRFAAMPLPESTFLGLSLLALAVLTAGTNSSGGRRVWLLTVALFLTALCVTLRVVGFALVPALAWACVRGNATDGRLRSRWTRRETLVGALILLVLALVAAFVLRAPLLKYGHEAELIYFGSDPFLQLRAHVAGFLEMIGELVVNVPLTRFRDYKLWFIVPGLASLAWAWRNVGIRCPRTPKAIYLVSFLVLLFLWPYNAIRLWLPILPLLIGYAVTVPARASDRTGLAMLKYAYIAWFAVMGLVSIAYTARITFSGNNFSRVYGRRGGLSDPDPVTGKVNEMHDAEAVYLMHRFGNGFRVSLPPALLGIKR